jgi:pimeloyl-ACP methyl ester carboxylesterase
VHIHFVHQRGVGPNPFPLVITHGWPSSFTEMLKLVPLLTDPAAHGGNATDAFDVVVPSLPGYGFSDRCTQPGMGLFVSIARLWNRVMTEALGYQRYGSCGWDLGAAVSNRLGAMFPKAVAGIYGPGIWYAPDEGPPFDPDERAFVERRDRWIAENGAYAATQSTRPQTLAYGLTDSPVGLAGWMIEKFRAWSDCGGVVERRFSPSKSQSHAQPAPRPLAPKHTPQAPPRTTQPRRHEYGGAATTDQKTSSPASLSLTLTTKPPRPKATLYRRASSSPLEAKSTSRGPVRGRTHRRRDERFPAMPGRLGRYPPPHPLPSGAFGHGRYARFRPIPRTPP